MIPRLETERLVLRAPIMDDYPHYERTLKDPERSKYIDGPYAPDDAWKDFCSVLASWDLKGFGGWSVAHKETEVFLGMVAIGQPPSFPEIELGWVFQQDAEGQGFAFEAAQEMHNFAFGQLSLNTVVSYISNGNAKSIKLAEKLGATLDQYAPKNPDDRDCLVYRHWPKEAQQ